MPPPTPGNISQTVEVRPAQSDAPVPLSKKARFSSGVDVRVTAIRAITAQAQGPGEVSGPALAVTVQMTNSSHASIDLANVIVSLTDSAKAPGNQMSKSPSDPLPATLAGGRRATGVYVFTIAKNKRRPVTISVTYTTKAPTVVFVGNAP